MNAGSISPLLAESTARMTLASMLGKASFNVFSACSRGLNGLGGLAGGAGSSLGGGLGFEEASVLDGVTVPVSWSLSKSKGRAVVGDSGGPSEGLSGETGEGCGVSTGQVGAVTEREVNLRDRWWTYLNLGLDSEEFEMLPGKICP